MVLALKTSDQVTELYLFDGNEVIAEKKWQAERLLAQDLLGEVEVLIGGDFAKLSGLIVFIGPGSFTGLRIGISTMNALAYSLGIPIVGVNGENWIETGQKRLRQKQNDKIVVPEYGAEASITKPKR